MIPPAVELLGDRAEAEKLRGFALSQLRILLDTMKFQGLKQYTRIVRFSDGSYVRAFSSFGIDTVAVFVPPVSIPEREIVEIEEAVHIAPEPCEVGIEVKMPEVIGVDCCATADPVAYDTVNSDETIDRDGTASVIITDGCPPFTWSVAGTGFWFDLAHTLTEIETDARTVTLYADDTACGSATITVVDDCEDSCTGYVRCTEGQWAICASYSQGGCCYPPGYPCNEHTIYEDKYKWIINCGNRSGYGVDSWNTTCNGVGMSINASDVCQSGWKICTGGLYEWTC
jgi:hypothetical protein